MNCLCIHLSESSTKEEKMTYVVCYNVEMETMLQLLNDIYKMNEPTLTNHYSCRKVVFKTCNVYVNGKSE